MQRLGEKSSVSVRDRKKKRRLKDVVEMNVGERNHGNEKWVKVAVSMPGFSVIDVEPSGFATRVLVLEKFNTPAAAHSVYTGV
jgi:hypothetical protein